MVPHDSLVSTVCASSTGMPSPRADGIVVLSFDRAGESGQHAGAGRAARTRRHARAARAGPAQGPGDALGQGQRASSPAPTSANSRRSTRRARSATRSAAASRCSSAWPSCPAPRSPRSTATAWAAAPNSRWPAAIASPANDPSTRIGLPEVKLGIYPGLGRQRAPAAAGRRAGGVRHDADRPHAVGLGGARDRPGRQGGRTGDAGRRRRRARAASGTQRPFKQRVAGVGDQHLAGAPAARADAGQAGRAQGAQGALPRAVRADRTPGDAAAAACSRCWRPNASRW